MVGAGFGCSYSMTQIDLMSWINTSFYLKMIRIILGVGSFVGVQMLFNLLKNDGNVTTDYFFYYALPQLVTGLFIYGPLVMICVKMGLITPYKAKK
mgnify:CR=1 FL=1